MKSRILKQFRPLLSGVLAASMAMTMVGCGASGNGQKQDVPAETSTEKAEAASGAAEAGTETASSESEASKEIKDVKIFSYVYGDAPDQDTMNAVLGKINEIMNPKGVNVEMELTTAASYDDELRMKLASGEEVDLCAIRDNIYSGLVTSGSLMPLDDLLDQYGQGIKEAYGGEDQLGWLLNATRMNGSLYAIPVLDNKCNFGEISFNKDLVDKYNMDLSQVKSLDDLEPLLSEIHEKEPNVKPLIAGAQPFSMLTIIFVQDPSYEQLGDGIGVLLGKDNWDVVDLYETPQYMEFCKKMHEWFKAGYISPDIVTSGETIDSYWKTGNAFSSIRGTTDLNVETASKGDTRAYGVNTVDVEIVPPKATFLKMLDCIPVTAKNPDAAMILLNELYTNKELINTLYWGVEGIHWTMEDGICTPTENDTYSRNQAFWFMFGNYYNSTERPSNELGDIEKGRELMMNCDSNRSLGFYFDSSSVSAQYAAVQNVLEQYRKGLEFGVLDPEVEIPNFVNKLKAAGIDDIIAEKQKQLDKWVADNNK